MSLCDVHARQRNEILVVSKDSGVLPIPPAWLPECEIRSKTVPNLARNKFIVYGLDNSFLSIVAFTKIAKNEFLCLLGVCSVTQHNSGEGLLQKSGVVQAVDSMCR